MKYIRALTEMKAAISHRFKNTVALIFSSFFFFLLSYYQKLVYRWQEKEKIAAVDLAANYILVEGSIF